MIRALWRAGLRRYVAWLSHECGHVCDKMQGRAYAFVILTARTSSSPDKTWMSACRQTCSRRSISRHQSRWCVLHYRLSQLQYKCPRIRNSAILRWTSFSWEQKCRDVIGNPPNDDSDPRMNSKSRCPFLSRQISWSWVRRSGLGLG